MSVGTQATPIQEVEVHMLPGHNPSCSSQCHKKRQGPQSLAPAGQWLLPSCPPNLWAEPLSDSANIRQPPVFPLLPALSDLDEAG